jgi:hypothetical protein
VTSPDDTLTTLGSATADLLATRASERESPHPTNASTCSPVAWKPPAHWRLSGLVAASTLRCEITCGYGRGLAARGAVDIALVHARAPREAKRRRRRCCGVQAKVKVLTAQTVP